MSLIKIFDERRDFVVPGNKQETIHFAVSHFIEKANEAITARGAFFVALSGGSTPKAIFKELALEENRNRVDYSKVYLFWSDERAVSKSDEESNYKMAMDSGFNVLGVPENQIFPMEGEGDLSLNAKKYEDLIQKIIPSKKFDYMMLGMGEDGHTASLFPDTKGLHVEDRLVTMNQFFKPNSDKPIYRLSLTFKCINEANQIVIYVLGKEKAVKIQKVLHDPMDFEKIPIQLVGTKEHKALFIMDKEAASLL